jgi:hypothetical protein
VGSGVFHRPLFQASLRSIERRSSEYVCYICGLRNSFLRRGLIRYPSTRMYVKRDRLAVEIFGKCVNHSGSPLSVDGTLVPRSVETDEDLRVFIEGLGLIADNQTVFMFVTDEDSRSGWKVLDPVFGGTKGNKTNASNASGNASVPRARSQSALYNRS